MLSEEWHTFNTPDLHSDAAVFQFQLMYEHLEMFRRQRWLGEALALARCWRRRPARARPGPWSQKCSAQC